MRRKREKGFQALRQNEQSTVVNIVIDSNLAKEIGSSPIADASRVYSNERSRKNKCSSGQKPPTKTRKWRRRNEKKPLYNRGR